MDNFGKEKDLDTTDNEHMIKLNLGNFGLKHFFNTTLDREDSAEVIQLPVIQHEEER